RPDAAQADREADVGNAPVGVAEERSGALEPAREEVLMRRLAEHAVEFPTEVGRREVRHPRQGGHVERLPIAGIHQILGAEEVTRRMQGPHDREYRCAELPRLGQRHTRSCSSENRPPARRPKGRGYDRAGPVIAGLTYWLGW